MLLQMLISDADFHSHSLVDLSRDRSCISPVFCVSIPLLRTSARNYRGCRLLVPVTVKFDWASEHRRLLRFALELSKAAKADLGTSGCYRNPVHSLFGGLLPEVTD